MEEHAEIDGRGSVAFGKKRSIKFMTQHVIQMLSLYSGSATAYQTVWLRRIADLELWHVKRCKFLKFVLYKFDLYCII